MEHNRRLATFATASPEVDTGDWPSLYRVASSNDLGLRWVLGHKFSKEGKVVGIRMVRVKPRQVGCCRSDCIVLANGRLKHIFEKTIAHLCSALHQTQQRWKHQGPHA